jgi:hypothetical protein
MYRSCGCGSTPCDHALPVSRGGACLGARAGARGWRAHGGEGRLLPLCYRMQPNTPDLPGRNPWEIWALRPAPPFRFGRELSLNLLVLASPSITIGRVRIRRLCEDRTLRRPPSRHERVHRRAHATATERTLPASTVAGGVNAAELCGAVADSEITTNYDRPSSYACRMIGNTRSTSASVPTNT